MEKSGLVSISFRKYSPEDILKAMRDAGLDHIEWGGDVHAPHGNIEECKKIRDLSEKYGIKIAEYGSYYKIAQSSPELFSEAVASARALGTNIIRVWPGMNTPSDTVSEEDYQKFVKDAQRICDEAPDMTVALECHPHSLTDEYHHALDFIKAVGRDNLKTFWQPNQYRSIEYNLESIKTLLPYIVSAHVFYWKRKSRYPLADGTNEWRQYIDLLSEKNVNYMLEFMHDDKIETLNETASTLKGWLNQ
jgi:sugar phosphate isomerase/epimerase